jgi:hypothetical protein
MQDTYLFGFEQFGSAFGLAPSVFWILFAILAVWTIIIKGVALWHAARGSQKAWFIALLIINTFGILEIIYLLGFRKDKSSHTPSLFTASEGASSPSA